MTSFFSSMGKKVFQSKVWRFLRIQLNLQSDRPITLFTFIKSEKIGKFSFFNYNNYYISVLGVKRK